MAQPHPLRHMPCTRTPHKRILKTLLQRPVDSIAHILNRRLIPHDEGIVEIRLDALPLRVDANEAEFFPAPVDDVLDPEVQLTGHDAGVGFVGEGVEVLEADGVDFVVDVDAFDVGAVVFHYYVDELVDCCCGVTLV